MNDYKARPESVEGIPPFTRVFTDVGNIISYIQHRAGPPGFWIEINNLKERTAILSNQILHCKRNVDLIEAVCVSAGRFNQNRIDSNALSKRRAIGFIKEKKGKREEERAGFYFLLLWSIYPASREGASRKGLRSLFAPSPEEKHDTPLPAQHCVYSSEQSN